MTKPSMRFLIISGGTSERPYIKNNILYVKLTESKLYTSYQLEESILKLGINKVKILNNHANTIVQMDIKWVEFTKSSDFSMYF